MALGSKNDMREQQSRFYALAAFAFLAFMAIVVRLYGLQISRGDEFTQKSEENFVQKLRRPAARGIMYDSQMRVLVDTRAALDLYATPAFIQGLDGSLNKLEKYLELTPDERTAIYKRLKGAKGLDRFLAVLIRRDLSRDQLELIESDRVLGELNGFAVVDSGVRDYLYGPLLAHVTGYLNEIGPIELEARLTQGDTSYELGDLLGRRGLERTYEHILRGKDGSERIVVDSKGRRQSEAMSLDLLGDKRRIESTPGRNLVLSIDLDVQQAIEMAFGDLAGVVIVVEVETGFIVALYSTPAYDPNRVTGRLALKEKERLDSDPLKPWINRAIQEHYAPGSTYKALTALTALEKGLITPDTFLPCPGYYKYGGNTWRCFKDSGHGGMQLHKSIVVSCDAYYYNLGARLGIDALAQTAHAFGFGRRTGIPLDQEIPGIVPTSQFHNEVNARDGGYRLSYAINTAVGQGANAFTPLQLVMAYAAIANGGKLYEPQLVRRIDDANGKPLETFGPKLINEINYKDEYWAVVREGLCGVVNEAGGTASGQKQKDLLVCGKTGTAQVAKLKKRVKTAAEKDAVAYALRDNAWFVGFAPGEAPKYAAVALTEHAWFGGSSSAPKVIAAFRAALKGEKPTKAMVKVER